MSDYGLTIIPKTTGKQIDITAGSRSMKFLGFYDYTKTSDQQSGNKAYIDIIGRTTGSSIYIVPVVIGFPYVSDPVSSIASIAYVDNYWMEGNRLWLHYWGASNSTTFKFAEIAVFEVLPAGVSSIEYGLTLTNATNYLEISSATQAGCCVWAGTVTINGSWSAPSSILNRPNCIIWGNWNNANITLMYDNAAKTIYCYDSSGKSASTSINILIFSSGFYPMPPDYGLAIWNAEGNCTFSSDYPPLILSGTVKLNTKVDNWVNTGIANPLIPICSTGAAKGGYAGQGYSAVHFCGIKMSNGRVSGGKGQLSDLVTESSWYFDDGISPLQIPFLDANNYF